MPTPTDRRFRRRVQALESFVGNCLAERGWDRRGRPFGTGGRLGQVLGGGATLARRAPVAIVFLALVASAGAAAAGSQVDTSYSAEAFLADDPPEWTERLPVSAQPGEFFLKDNREYVYGQFQSPDQQGQILLRGNMTAPRMLDSVADAEAAAANASVTVVRPSGEPAVVSPVSAMQWVASENETFDRTLQAADTDGDGVLDENLTAVYDGFFAAAPELADRYVHRTADGEYAALKIRMAVDGTADRAAVTAAIRDVAATVESGDAHLQATATGRPVVVTEVTERLTATVVRGLAVTLTVILCLLVVVFRLRAGSGSLGAVTVAPVLCTLSWLLGTMALLDVPVSVITALVGSIAVGLGVDYTIHVTERFTHELDRGLAPVTALHRTVVGTGGALLASAITTAAGFGVLAFALFPGLQQFGLLLAVAICYAFLASVFVQPSVLALWARYGPDPVTEPASIPSVGDD